MIYWWGEEVRMNTVSAGSRSYGTLVMAATAFCLLFISGCSSSLTGQVFVDKNNNGVMDADEVGVPNAKIIVTRDDETVAEKYADVNGVFTVRLKNTSGKTCVRTDLSYAQNNLGFLQSSSGKAEAIKSLTVHPLAQIAGSTGTGTSTSTTSSTVGDNTSAGSNTTTSGTTTQPTFQAGWYGDQYCKDAQGKGFSVEIPVTVNTSEAISELPTRLEVKAYTGASFDLKVPYPKECTVYVPLTDDFVFTPASQDGLSYDSSLNIVSSEASAQTSKAETTQSSSAMPSITVQGNFSVADIKLAIKDDIDLDATTNSKSIKISPYVTCPGTDTNQHTALQTIPVTITRDINAAVYQKVNPAGSLSGNQQVTLTVGIENKGKSPILDGELNVTIPDGTTLSGSMPKNCVSYNSGSSTKVLCKLQKLETDYPKSIYVVGFVFTTPDMTGKTDPLDLTSDAEFTATNLTQPIKADQVDMTVQVP